MNQNQKKKQMTRGLTIALALLVVAAIVVTIVAVVSSKRTKPTPSDTTGTTPGQTTGTTAPEQTTKPGDEPIVADDVTFISPVTNGNISKEWSAEIPVYSDTMEDYRVHLGVDIEADAGTPVYAAADGIIESVTLDPMMGQTIVISHNGGYKSVYQNLQTVIPEGIAEGVTVKAGDEIGAIGDTALVEISQSPHLHFEIYNDDECEDPLTYVTVAPIDDETYYED